MDEFADTAIPEFTLGPKCFEVVGRPKPLSVNKMGFYEECKNLEAKISPIKKISGPEKPVNSGVLNNRKFSNKEKESGVKYFDSFDHNEKLSESEENFDFYENNDLVKNSGICDSTEKYIELVDN